MDSEDLLFLMYTSGTTAKPKGIATRPAGYLVGVAATHHYIFDLKPETDVYWCAADIGWITGHSYIVYGPLCNATTSVLYEGTPDFPDHARWWSIVERYGVTILYTAPTAIRAHMKWGPEHAAKHDLSSLRLLGSVGEPINPEAWIWYHEHIGGGRCPVVDTWWQTETGMILITPLPGVTTTKPGSATKPFPGVVAAVLNEQGERVEQGGGYLVLERPWPAMTRGIFGDDERYRATYWERFPGFYFAGDGARIDADGDFWLLGRVDDVMNVSGHRISTIEVESALVDHPKVAEAAVCGRSDATTGQAIVAYVTLKGSDPGSVEMLEELRDHVSHKIGAIAKPANIVFTPELPKTRSGKIMRRLLRDVAEHRPLGDTTTLADPAVVSEIAERAAADPPADALATARQRPYARSAASRRGRPTSVGHVRPAQPRATAVGEGRDGPLDVRLARPPAETEMRIAAPPVPGRGAHPRLALACTAEDAAAFASSSSNRKSTWLSTTSFSTSHPGQRGDLLRRRRACAHHRSTSSATPSRPSSRIAAHTGTAARGARTPGCSPSGRARRRVLRDVEVRRRVLHRRLVVGGMGAEGDPAVVRHVQPLVRVGRPRIRPLVARRRGARGMGSPRPRARTRRRRGPTRPVCGRSPTIASRRSSNAPVFTSPACAQTIVGTPSRALPASAETSIRPSRSAGRTTSWPRADPEQPERALDGHVALAADDDTERRRPGEARSGGPTRPAGRRRAAPPRGT